MQIAIPRQLNLKNAAAVLKTLQRRPNVSELRIDFTGIDFVYPAGAVVLLIGLQKLLAKRRDDALQTQILLDHRRSQGCGYLAAFGFFDELGFPHKDAPAPALKSDRYLTLTKITRDEVSFDGVPVQEKINQMSAHLAQMLLREQEKESPIVQAVGYALRESIRNVFEHAETDDAYVMAQTWSNGRAEFALGDAGIGIHESLAQTYKLEDEAHALRMAILPGITEYAGPETRDVWQNSGYGLYMMSEVARVYGRLDLASSGQLLTVHPDGDAIEPTNAQGVTVLALQVRVPDDVYWANFLESARIRGEGIAKTIPGARTVASAPSGGLWR